MNRDVENDDEEVDTEHEKRKRRVILIFKWNVENTSKS
jgi:hypothetical protein